MPKVTVQKQTSLSAQEAYSKVTGLLAQNQDLKKLDPSYQCQFDEANLSGEAKGKMFTAKMKISNAAGGANVEITVELPLALTLAKGMVQKTLEKTLHEVFS